MERPTYDRTLLSLRERGAQVHAVELEPDGIDTDALAGLLGGRAGVRPQLAHIIPNFQNPAGYTLSLAKRQALLALAAEHDFWVFEDDPYVELRFSGETLPTMLSMDPKHVVYASSFSKTVCPGIRVGYLVGPAELIAAIAKLATNTYISPSMVAQSIVYEFCASGAIDALDRDRQDRARRARARRSGRRSQRELPEAEFVAPEGGYFMWVTLPAGTDVSALHKAAGERGVAFVKGTDFVLEGGENTLRLAYSGVTPEQIDEGVARLAGTRVPLAAPDSAPVALAEHELLGQGGARGRRGVGDHRDGLGDARGDSAAPAVRGLAPPPARRRAPSSVPSRPGSRPEAFR